MVSKSATATQRVEAESRFYRPELDALRFGAFALVFLAHAMPDPASLPPALRRLCAGLSEGLGFGVDLFFVLSSYLITELLLREYARKQRIDVKAFWVRRILRIWPLYFTFLAAAIWLAPLVLPQNFPMFHRAAYALFWGNFALIVDSRVNTVAGILWSVSIEEQFYLLWPLVMSYFIGRLKQIAIGLILVSSLTRVLLAASGATELWSFWSNTPARLDPIAAGALMAVLLNGGAPRISNRIRVAALVLGLALIVVCGIAFPRVGWGALVGYPLATIAAVLLLAGILGAPWRVPKQLVYLGRISYGLYVFHVAALRLVHEYINVPVSPVVLSLIRFVGSLGLTVVLASFSYRWLERPFLRLKDHFAVIQSH
jgi:peptidoglycan/LPS O-acetylase OafA/YrhL